MTVKELYDQIDQIYRNNGFEFKLLFNDILILSQDNVYLIIINSLRFSLRIEYSLHSKTKYKLFIHEDEEAGTYESVPDIILEKVLPVLRDFKIKKLLNES